MSKTRQELLDTLNDITGNGVGGWYGEMHVNNVMRDLQEVAEVLKRVVKRVFPKDEEEDDK